MIPDMTCKQGPHVRTRPQTFRVPVSCIPFNSISGRHTPARNREAQSQTTAAYDRKEGLRHAHEKKKRRSMWRRRGTRPQEPRWPVHMLYIKVRRLCHSQVCTSHMESASVRWVAHEEDCRHDPAKGWELMSYGASCFPIHLGSGLSCWYLDSVGN